LESAILLEELIVVLPQIRAKGLVGQTGSWTPLSYSAPAWLPRKCPQ